MQFSTLVINRFYPVDTSRNSKKGGHELGLSIATRIVEKCNRNLDIKSKIDVGTIVELTFKL
ncbi:ATP-binding protein [Priestia koreensis]|uniref:ATP-binding protein n=1 Tax=Priestia koreensis TaxID=284581 RepID=UPI00345AF232